MHPSKRAEFNNMLIGYDYVEVTYLINGKMSEAIKCTSFTEVEQLVSEHGANNVFF